jgi:hypothetical protein
MPPKADALRALDRAAARAIENAKDDATRQLAALGALDALADACAKQNPDGVLMHSVRAARAKRARDYATVHRADVQDALRAHAVEGARAQEHLVRTLENCLTFLRATEGVTGEVRTLELQLQDARRGEGGAPRPFFARFLEDGRQTR